LPKLTFFLVNILIDRIIWCYGEESAKPNFEKVEYFKGVSETVENETNEQILLILDDLIMGAFNKNVCELFTKGSHHRNLLLIVVIQNIFHKSALKKSSKNCLMKNKLNINGAFFY